MAFTWVYLDEAGKPVADLPTAAVIAEFTTRSEAEIWLTTNWRLLLNGECIRFLFGMEQNWPWKT